MDKAGYLPLHTAMVVGNTELGKLVLSVAPHTLNQETAHRETALYLAAKEGDATAVGYLLSAGATHPTDPDTEMCPIAVAVLQGHEEALRVLFEKGSDTVGGLLREHPVAVVSTVTKGNARILHQVFTCLRGEGDDLMQLDGYAGLGGPVLHYAAGYAVPASVRTLLAVRANESAPDFLGQRACDVVGTMDTEYPAWDSRIDPTLPKSRERDPVQEALILRLLERGPAFRARSWAWPAGPSSCSAATGTASKRCRHNSMPSVRLFRSKDTKFFVKRIGR